MDWSSLARGVQQGLSYFQTGAQIAGSLAGAFGGNDPGARDFALWANRLGQGAGQVNNFMQSRGGGPAAAAQGNPPWGQFQQSMPMSTPAGPQFQQSMPTSMPAGPPQSSMMLGGPADLPAANATALMALLMSNPQFMQALQAAPFSTGMPSVAVNPPNSAPVPIPLSAVMNTLAQLAQASSRELSEMSTEGEAQIPEYLLADDGSLIADPASPQEQAELVLNWLRAGAQARRLGMPEANGFGQADFNDSGAWAREAGFDD